MKRKKIIKQWELEFGVKYKNYERANVYTAVDIIDFAESVANKLTIPDVSEREEVREFVSMILNSYKLLNNETGHRAVYQLIVMSAEKMNNKLVDYEKNSRINS